MDISNNMRTAVDHTGGGRAGRLATPANSFSLVFHGLYRGYQLRNLDREADIMRTIGERIILEFIVHTWPSV